jgi:hypothetical protein
MIRTEKPGRRRPFTGPKDSTTPLSPGGASDVYRELLPQGAMVRIPPTEAPHDEELTGRPSRAAKPNLWASPCLAVSEPRCAARNQSRWRLTNLIRFHNLEQ